MIMGMIARWREAAKWSQRGAIQLQGRGPSAHGALCEKGYVKRSGQKRFTVNLHENVKSKILHTNPG